MLHYDAHCLCDREKNPKLKSKEAECCSREWKTEHNELFFVLVIWMSSSFERIFVLYIDNKETFQFQVKWNSKKNSAFQQQTNRSLTQTHTHTAERERNVYTKKGTTIMSPKQMIPANLLNVLHGFFLSISKQIEWDWHKERERKRERSAWFVTGCCCVFMLLLLLILCHSVSLCLYLSYILPNSLYYSLSKFVSYFDSGPFFCGLFFLFNALIDITQRDKNRETNILILKYNRIEVCNVTNDD